MFRIPLLCRSPSLIVLCTHHVTCSHHLASGLEKIFELGQFVAPHYGCRKIFSESTATLKPRGTVPSTPKIYFTCVKIDSSKVHSTERFKTVYFLHSLCFMVPTVDIDWPLFISPKRPTFLCAGKWHFLVSFFSCLSQKSQQFMDIMAAGQMLMPPSTVEVMLLGQWVS